ncbi:TPA: ImmA/IrrE family metallo-endopeptidase [Staphylococcus aureus]|uniref:ImmA/IrrE family metallo-endopeptidase n=3 Tax=Staphylococcus aureus TaxID=1280 RepID=UPI0002B9DE93|nr:ImmA/IrrE family metallo-endopeptidase [Staphylococcus aureus]EIB2245851.1 ImmA/IrrE family metallo-endopeptidase [Staphylococcus aureus]EJX1692704.1 ImmA/IrrE family metallo-endopeptidase [Staphylococcus aureus]EJX3516798.1 ImmA/IrrE family metallo-endopeptidase [Staphylococcus aureus]MBG1067817.1 ImmA/IrrE family metallo-endopeptidase [Staphylococcus aureus]MBG1215801.1 ImmA/IrrE family metallo-endopeptidase [Staphylococcus aureus]
MFTPIVINLLNDVGSIFLVRVGNQLKVIEKVHYEDILESKIVRLFQAFIKDKMDQLFITSEHFAIDIDKLLFQLNLNVRYIKMEGNTSGYLSGRTIYINNNHSINNTRFAIARELGRYLYKIKDNNDNSLKNLHEMIYESDVNQFSVDLLMPKKQIEALVYNFYEVNNINLNSGLSEKERNKLLNLISSKLEVSKIATGLRLYNLGIHI